MASFYIEETFPKDASHITHPPPGYVMHKVVGHYYKQRISMERRHWHLNVLKS